MIENAQYLQQLKPPTKAELRACAAKEMENLQAKAKEMGKNSAPMINQSTQPRPQLKPTTEVEHVVLNAPNKDNLIPVNVKVCTMSALDESVIPPCHQCNLTDEGRCHAAEVAKKELK